MLSRIVEARALEGYQLYLRFDDGAEGVVDVAKAVPFDGVFAPLRDQACFQQVRVRRELGTVWWPNGADLDPDVLHAQVVGTPMDVPAAGD